MNKRIPSRGEHLRAAIAQEAARLMAEHGIQDYEKAKRKAAERYGVWDGALMPRNVEIEAAVASYQRLFGGREHEENLRRLREVAVKAMRLLADIEPRMVGAVLSGTATAHSDVELHVFSDSPEAVLIALMDRGVRYQATQRSVRRQATKDWTTLPGVRFDCSVDIVEAVIFPRDGIRHAVVDPVNGKPIKRASSTVAASASKTSAQIEK